MDFKKALSVSLLLTAQCAHSQNQSSNAGNTEAESTLFKAEMKMCIAVADVAKVITTETLASGKFDPRPSLLKNTVAGSELRAKTAPIFSSSSILKSVLIETAGAGLLVLPSTEGKLAAQEIAMFAFDSVLHSCAFDVLKRYAR
jgi:hypothetical protein